MTKKQVGQFLSVSSLSNLITAVRVKSIVLTESHPRFKELGEWNGLGTIEYDIVAKPSYTNSEQFKFPTAKPLLPNIKNFPLVNEIVYLLSLPDTNIGENSGTTTAYYINTVGIWNHPHHNAYPEDPSNLNPSQLNDYTSSTDNQTVRRVEDNSTGIFLGNTFQEKTNIHPLLPFEGDVVYEGRWGNSIRFGSTVTASMNNWSNTGLNGDPLIIIRNGQGEQTDEGWIPITENINNDHSSIYLTSTQQIPLQGVPISYNSYQTPPSQPSKYSGKQIILNSDRLIFNSNNDHTLFSSAKSINLNSLESINIDTKDTIIQTSGKIYLADKNASQQALLGNKTVDFLRDLLTSLNQVATALTALAEILPPTPQVGVNTSAAELNATVSRLLSQINNLLSNDVYIKDNGIPLSTNSSLDSKEIKTALAQSPTPSQALSNLFAIGPDERGFAEIRRGDSFIPEEETSDILIENYDVILVAGLDELYNKTHGTSYYSLTKQTSIFKTNLNNKRVAAYRYSDPTDIITSTIKENPNAYVVLFSAGCAKANSIATAMKYKDRLFIVEPYTVNLNGSTAKGIVSAVQSGVPSTNVIVGTSSSVGSNMSQLIGKTTRSNISNCNDGPHWCALQNSGKLIK